jgi:prophage antirepressor-like protein
LEYFKVFSQKHIDEAGLYSLIFNSKLKKAKDFRDKVFEEVFPSIRKTGEYKMTEQIEVLQDQLTKSEDEKLQIMHRYNSRFLKHKYHKFKKQYLKICI